MNSAIANKKFGIEIESKGLNRLESQLAIYKACKVIYGASAQLVLTSPGGYYEKKGVKLPDGREWIAMTDASVRNGSEVVSPICTYADMPLVQEIARQLRRSGAYVDSDCGIHVHVDASDMDAPALGRLAAITHQYEPLLKEAIEFNTRREQWAKSITLTKVKAMRKAKNMVDSAIAWYDGRDYRDCQRQHYHNSRYAGLNLHSTFYRGTIEFRYFNATLHAGEIRSYVCLCLGIVGYAKRSKRAGSARAKIHSHGGKKQTFYSFLYNKLQLKGGDMKAVRDHLIKNLPGQLQGGYRYEGRESDAAQVSANRAA